MGCIIIDAPCHIIAMSILELYLKSFSTSSNGFANMKGLYSFMMQKEISIGDYKQEVYYFSDIIVDCLSKKEINDFLRNCAESFNLDKDLIIYSIDVKKITYFSSKFYVFNSFRNKAIVKDLALNGNLDKKIRKGLGFYSINMDECNIRAGLNLYRYMDYATGEFDKLEMIKLCTLFCHEDAIRIFAVYDNEVLGCMLGIIINGTSYMLIHFYNNKYKNYLNETLYYCYINESKKRGVNIIDWGETDFNDIGLLTFKNRFSTECIKCKNILIKKKE